MQTLKIKNLERSGLMKSNMIILIKRLFEKIEKADLSTKNILRTTDEVFAEIIRRRGKELISYGYPYPPNMTLGENSALSKALKDSREDSKEIDVFMTDHFNQQRIQKMILEWNTMNIVNFNQKRLKILNEALDAHSKGMYFVAVPTFLSQIEGIIVDIYGLNEKKKMKKYTNGSTKLTFSDQKKLVKYLLDLHSNKNNQRGYRNIDEERKHPMNAFNDLLNEYYDRLLLTRFLHGQDGNDNLSRHGILHGANMDYGKQETSLKILLFIDLLFRVLIELDLEPLELENSLHVALG